MAINPIFNTIYSNNKQHIYINPNMSLTNIVAYLALMTVALYVVQATDPNQLQDFCVGVTDPKDALFVNGLFCKNPMEVKSEDFFFPGLAAQPRPTNSRVGSNVTTVSALQFPGLNTLGISLARIDYRPGGLNTPHVHPRGTEVLTVLEGTLYVGFVTSNLPDGENKFFPMLLKKGDVFIFPQGLIHFQLNVGKYPAVALSALSSQNPGVISIADAVFGADPPINVDVLSTAFQLDPKIVKDLQSKFNMMSD